MRCSIVHEGQFEDLNLHHVFMLAGRFDMVSSTGHRTRRQVPHEFSLSSPSGLYVRLDRPTYSRVGSADEVKLERDFSGQATLSVDDCVIRMDGGSSLYVSRFRPGKALEPFSSVASVQREESES